MTTALSPGEIAFIQAIRKEREVARLVAIADALDDLIRQVEAESLPEATEQLHQAACGLDFDVRSALDEAERLWIEALRVGGGA